MALIRLIFWTAVFAAATFAFTVLFEHGPTNFAENARKEATALQAMFNKSEKGDKRKDGDKLTPPAR